MTHQRLLEYLDNKARESGLAGSLPGNLAKELRAKVKQEAITAKKQRVKLHDVDELLEVLKAGYLCMGHGCAVTDDIEFLRKIALLHNDWWNFLVTPLLTKYELPFDALTAEQNTRDLIERARVKRFFPTDGETI